MFGIEDPFWIFIILGVVVALNSDKIDKVVQSDTKIKQLIIVLCCIFILVISYIMLNIFSKII